MLQRVLKKTRENENLKETVEYAAEKDDRALASAGWGRAVKAVGQALEIARSNIRHLQARPGWLDAKTRRTMPASDVALFDEIKAKRSCQATAIDVSTHW